MPIAPKQLYVHRRKLHLTQEQAASALEITQARYSQLEKHGVRSIRTARRIRRILGF